MAETTFTWLSADGTTIRTGLAGANASSQLAPSAVLYDVNGAVLVGQKARGASLPVALSSEDVTLLTALQTLLDGLATAAETQSVSLQADARTTALVSGLWTLAAGVVESITIPAWARGFRLRPSADIRFAISDDPVAAGTETLTVGNPAFASENEVRLIEAGAVTLRLLATGATTVTVGFF